MQFHALMFFILASLLQNELASATEAELLDTFREKGSMACLGELYKRYSHLVYGVCLKYLKDRELAQDAVMEIWEKLSKELRTREVERFPPWLHVLSRNHCLMQLRSAKNKTTQAFSEITEHVVESALEVHPTDNTDELEEQLQAMESALEGLPEEQKKCVSLFFLKKMSYQQIVVETGYELKKVKSYIQNGKRNLKIALARITHEG